MKAIKMMIFVFLVFGGMMSLSYAETPDQEPGKKNIKRDNGLGPNQTDGTTEDDLEAVPPVMISGGIMGPPLRTSGPDQKVWGDDAQ